MKVRDVIKWVESDGCHNGNRMRLHIRPAEACDHQKIEDMVIESFEPITWFKKLDAQICPLNGRDWPIRSQARMKRVFESQIVLVGETGGGIVAMSSGPIDHY